MDANVSFTGNLGTDVEMKVGEDWRGARSGCPHSSCHAAGGVGRWNDDLDVGACLWSTCG